MWGKEPRDSLCVLRSSPKSPFPNLITNRVMIKEIWEPSVPEAGELMPPWPFGAICLGFRAG